MKLGFEIKTVNNREQRNEMLLSLHKCVGNSGSSYPKEEQQKRRRYHRYRPRGMARRRVDGDLVLVGVGQRPPGGSWSSVRHRPAALQHAVRQFFVLFTLGGPELLVIVLLVQRETVHSSRTLNL